MYIRACPLAPSHVVWIACAVQYNERPAAGLRERAALCATAAGWPSARMSGSAKGAASSGRERRPREQQRALQVQPVLAAAARAERVAPERREPELSPSPTLGAVTLLYILPIAAPSWWSRCS